MKMLNKKIMLVVLALAGLLVFESCDSENDPSSNEVTEEDFANIIGTALSEEDGGFAYDIDVLLQEVQEDCGYTRNESFTDQETIGVRSFEIDYSIAAEVQCSESEEFISLSYEYTIQRSAELIRLDVESSAISTWLFFNDGDNYILDGRYDYSGTETSKVGDKNIFTSTIEILSEDLKINADGDFLSGSLSVIHDIVSTFGDERSATGTITITSVNIGLLDLSGFDYLYEIDLKTGEVTQIER